MRIKIRWIIFFAFFLFNDLAMANPSIEHAQPRLVVIVSIDQFRGDYLARFGAHFGEDGFKRIQHDGFTYEQCFFPTANTETGPGHATIVTGAYGHRTGIAQNNWFDAAEGTDVYCVGDATVATVRATTPSSDAKKGSFSPARLLAGTVGDVLETATAGHSKTVSVSLKDRSAVLMGGRSCDRTLWFDIATGEFVSSSFYSDTIPQWVVDFNASDAAEQWFQKPWTLSLDPAVYEASCSRDDFVAENEAKAGFTEKAFPHILGAASTMPDKAYFTSVYSSPYGNDLLLALVKSAIANEGLGQDGVSDLLTVGFSSNDLVGHAFGPDSWETMDATIKTDVVLAELMRYLDEAVGAGQWSLVLSADHGVASIPELLTEHRIDAGRVSAEYLKARLEAHLKSTFGDAAAGTTYVQSVDVPWVALNALALPNRFTEVVESATGWLAMQPEVARAISSDELFARDVSGDGLLQAFRYCYFPGRTGDIAFALRPNYIQIETGTGTAHGSPYVYDRHVVLMAVGNRIAHGRSAETVSPAQIAPTASHLLGVLSPTQCEVSLLADALGL